MATVLVLLGSMLGFFTAVVSWTMLDVSFMSAMGIWMFSGPATALIVLALARFTASPQTDAEPALVEA